MKLSEVATALGLALEGAGELEIDGLAGLDDAGAHDLSFATGARYRDAYERSAAGACLLPPDFPAGDRPCLRSEAPYADFARAIDLLYPEAGPEPGVHPTAVVADDAELADAVSIGPYAVVGRGCAVGARSVIHAHVTLYPRVRVGADCEIHSGSHLREGTRIGDRCVLQNGVVLGSQGFGHAYRPDGTRVAIPHRSPVELGDDVEVGANTTIDASHPGHARLGHADTRTRVGSGSALDNLVQIGHGCTLGERVTICASSALGGSTIVGNSVFIGGRAATAGHLRIGDGALVGGGTGVTGDVAPGAQVLGTPHVERRVWARWAAARKRLPDLFRRVRRIEARLGMEGEPGE